MNEALALLELSSQASMYIPVTGTPQRLPSYVSLNRNSPWHTAALQATAFESITLPSRLRASRGTRTASLDELAAAVSPGGDRRIAQLSFELTGLDVPLQSDPCDLFPHGPDSRSARRIRTFAELEVNRGELSEAEPSRNGHYNDVVEEQEFRRYTDSSARQEVDSLSADVGEDMKTRCHSRYWTAFRTYIRSRHAVQRQCL